MTLPARKSLAGQCNAFETRDTIRIDQTFVVNVGYSVIDTAENRNKVSVK